MLIYFSICARLENKTVSRLLYVSILTKIDFCKLIQSCIKSRSVNCFMCHFNNLSWCQSIIFLLVSRHNDNAGKSLKSHMGYFLIFLSPDFIYNILRKKNFSNLASRECCSYCVCVWRGKPFGQIRLCGKLWMCERLMG